MRLPFGITITRERKAAPSSLATPSARGGWWPVVREGFAGAWQRNIEWRQEDVLTYAAVFACVSLISSDIAKLRLKLVQQQGDGTWTETESPAFSPVLRKPNHYQTRIQFFQSWMHSLLTHGNTYVLKARDNRGVVTGLYVLDPSLVRPMVSSEDGEVWYSLSADNLSRVQSGAIVPAREIIHDRINTFYHPLVGLSPITACGLAASQGLKVQENSTAFFSNGATPGGILAYPGSLSPEEVARLEQQWESNYSGPNYGRLAVLTGGFEYKSVNVMSAVDAQVIEQLRWTAENVCTAFRVPGHKVGVGPPPSHANAELLDLQYYSNCLQAPVESIEVLLDEGLGLDQQRPLMGVEFEIDDLLRMDTATKIKAASEAISGSGMSPNEARRRFLDLGPVKGGESPMAQQQYYSLAALAERDQDKPFSKPVSAAPASTPAVPADKSLVIAAAALKAVAEYRQRSVA